MYILFQLKQTIFLKKKKEYSFAHLRSLCVLLINKNLGSGN